MRQRQRSERFAMSYADFFVEQNWEIKSHEKLGLTTPVLVLPVVP